MNNMVIIKIGQVLIHKRLGYEEIVKDIRCFHDYVSKENEVLYHVYMGSHGSWMKKEYILDNYLFEDCSNVY